MDLRDEINRTEELLYNAMELREKLWQDPHRPKYHFMPPAGWMNDINGPLFWKGRYHIFYQHNPDGAYWKLIQWGHASSLDLVHWVHHPVALIPTPDGPDRDGCFSGGVVVKDGTPTFIYHGVPEGTCIATSEDDDLIRWTKYSGNPVIPVPRPDSPDFGKYIVYDPCAWNRDGVMLKVDMSKSSLNESIRYYYYRNHGALDRLPKDERVVQAQKAPFELYEGEILNLHIFLDNSVLEIFANKRQCITQRIYPTRSDSLGIVLFSHGGGMKVRSVEAWDMAPALS